MCYHAIDVVIHSARKAVARRVSTMSLPAVLSTVSKCHARSGKRERERGACGREVVVESKEEDALRRSQRRL